jgi:hypothetical protein
MVFMSFAEMKSASHYPGTADLSRRRSVVSLMTVAFWTVHRRAGFWITARPDEGGNASCWVFGGSSAREAGGGQPICPGDRRDLEAG